MDDIELLHILIPCAITALMAHPVTSHNYLNRVLWALCVYVEAVSVLPQLWMMQKGKIVERFTANYLFSLAVARLLSCAHWILQMFDAKSYLATALGSGLWPVMVLFSEVVQTFILADFCYYYVLSCAEGSEVVRLPVGVV
jgi:ER lumen protein retaining receptor